jgi:hypothetical protein
MREIIHHPRVRSGVDTKVDNPNQSKILPSVTGHAQSPDERITNKK